MHRSCRCAGTGAIGGPERLEIGAVVSLSRSVLGTPRRRRPDSMRADAKPIPDQARDFGLADLVRSLVALLTAPLVPSGIIHGVKCRHDSLERQPVHLAGIEHVADSRQQDDDDILIVIAIGKGDRCFTRQCAPCRAAGIRRQSGVANYPPVDPPQVRGAFQG